MHADVNGKGRVRVDPNHACDEFHTATFAAFVSLGREHSEGVYVEDLHAARMCMDRTA